MRIGMTLSHLEYEYSQKLLQGAGSMLKILEMIFLFFQLKSLNQRKASLPISNGSFLNSSI